MTARNWNTVRKLVELVEGWRGYMGSTVAQTREPGSREPGREHGHPCSQT